MYVCIDVKRCSTTSVSYRITFYAFLLNMSMKKYLFATFFGLLIRLSSMGLAKRPIEPTASQRAFILEIKYLK